MHLLFIIGTSIYLWSFLKLFIYKVPDWAIHLLLVPLLVYGVSLLPSSWLLLGTACGAVYLVDRLVGPVHTVSRRSRKARSNIPPPP